MDTVPSETPRENGFGQPVGQPVFGWEPPDIPEKTSVEGKIVRLEPFDVGKHGLALFDAFSEDREGRGWTYLPYGPFLTFEDFEGWARSFSGTMDPQFYAVILKGGEKPVGVASFLRIDPKNGSIEVGHIHFSPALKRSPAATEAMYLMMRRAFEMGYRRYEWKCDALNAVSCSAAERLGLSFEGVFRQATVYKGRNRDTAWFAAVDHEWPALRVAFERWVDPGNFDEEGKQRVSLRELTEGVVKKRMPI